MNVRILPFLFCLIHQIFCQLCEHPEIPVQNTRKVPDISIDILLYAHASVFDDRRI
jgi:hypothetical protein